MSRRRNVSNCATRHIERLGIDALRPHISQYAPACRNSRSRVERIIARIEVGAEGPDTRFIVTNLKVRNARVLYEDVYCRRGQAENHIKSWKTHLAADRTSCTKATANQLRAFGPIEELLEAAELAVLLRRGLEARLRAGLDALDMAAQCRGRPDAQDVIETVGPAPVENFGTAIIMAVGAQQDLGVWPVGADRPQQAAQEGPDLLAARPFGGAKHRRDEAALAVEYDDRLETIFVVAMRSRCSISRSIRTPPSDDKRPPSNLTTTVLPETGDRPGSGSIRLFMAGVVSLKWRGLALAPISYAKSAVCAISADVRCIMRVSSRLSRGEIRKMREASRPDVHACAG
jgi:Transposase DDE domain group 1